MLSRIGGRGLCLYRIGVPQLSHLPELLHHLGQAADGKTQLLGGAAAAVECPGHGVDVPASLIRKGDGRSRLFLPVEYRAVSLQLSHQPGVGGQSGSPAFFFQQVVFLLAHPDAGAVCLCVHVAPPLGRRLQGHPRFSHPS